MKRVMKGVALLMVATLGFGAALGASGGGRLVGSGMVTFEGVERSSYRPLGVFLGEVAGLVGLSVVEDRALACLHEHRITEATIAGQTFRYPTATQDDCRMLSDVRVGMTTGKASDGWIGIFPNSSLVLDIDEPTLEVGAPAVTCLESEGARTASARETDRPAVPAYVKCVAFPHLYLATAGRVSFRGDGLLKALGPVVRITSSDGTIEYVTGETFSPHPTGGERVIRWVSLFLDDAAGELETRSQAQIVAREAQVTLDGAISLTALSGSMWVADREYQARGSAETVGGNLTVALSPLPERVLVQLEGDIRSSSLSPAPRPPDARWSAGAWVSVLAAVVAGAGGAMLLLRRRRIPPARGTKRGPITPVVAPAPKPPAVSREEEMREEVVRRQASAMLMRGWHELSRSSIAADKKAALEAAAYYFTRAWQLAPDTGDAALGLAYTRYGLGEWLAAITEAARASFYVETGEPEVLAARSSLHLGLVEAAVEYLRRGLHRPSLTREVFRMIYEDHQLRPIVESHPSLSVVWEEAVEHFAQVDD